MVGSVFIVSHYLVKGEEDQKPLEGKFKRILDFIKEEVELKGSEAVAEEIRQFEESKEGGNNV